MDDHKEKEAISEVSRALSFKPESLLFYIRATFYASIGNTTAALRDCEAALCIKPDDADTRELDCKARAGATDLQWW